MTKTMKNDKSEACSLKLVPFAKENNKLKLQRKRQTL